MSAITLILVLLLCLPMADLPLSVGSSSSAIISDVDVCDADSPEILDRYLSVAEDFYSILNFSTVGFRVEKTEQNAAIALASRPERPPIG